MIKQYQFPCVLCVLLAGCGGGGGGSNNTLDDGLGDACNNTFHQTLIGQYTGMIDYPSQPGGAASIGSCRWTVSMEITGRSVGGRLCVLNAEIDAPVEQSVVLDATDGLAYECFEANGFNSVTDNVPSSVEPDQVSQIPFPHAISLLPNGDVPGRGPYFGDPAFTAWHLHLFDTTDPLVRSLLADGAGGLEVSGDSVNGTLIKENP